MTNTIFTTLVSWRLSGDRVNCARFFCISASVVSLTKAFSILNSTGIAILIVELVTIISATIIAVIMIVIISLIISS